MSLFASLLIFICLLQTGCNPVVDDQQKEANIDENFHPGVNNNEKSSDQSLPNPIPTQSPIATPTASVTVTPTPTALPLDIPEVLSIEIDSAAVYATSQTVSVEFVLGHAQNAAGVCLQESATTPALGDGCWDADITSPNAYTFSSDGNKTLYLFVKDASGNISNFVDDEIVIDSSPPTTPTVIFRADDTTYASGHQIADNDTTVNVVWSGASDGGAGLATANTYSVYVYDESVTVCLDDGSNNASAVATSNLTTTSYGFTGTTGKNYKAQVRTYDVVGNSSWSACTGLMLIDTSAPTAPTVIFRADDTTYASGHQSADNDTAINVVWSGASDGGAGLATANTYSVYVYDESVTVCLDDGSNNASAVATSNLTTTSYGFTGTNEETYKAQIRTYDAVGNSSWSLCSSTMTPLLPPSGLSYSTSPATYTKWTAITANNPTIGGGAVASYSVSPALPTGLSLNTTTGVISGTPEQHDEVGTDYTITATNASGSTNVVVNIKVMIPNFTWLNTTLDNQWNTAANWKGGSVPTGTSTVFIDNSCGADCDLLLNATVDVQNLFIKSNYPGVVTQGNGISITVGTGNYATQGGIVIDGGSFIGSNAPINTDILNIRGTGSFTSTSDELRIGTFTDHYSISTGMILESTATFNHNNGLVRIDARGNAAGFRRIFQITADQKIEFYDLDIDIESDAIYVDGTYNRHRMDIYGTSATISVENDLNFINGNVNLGTIEFYGSNVTFHCDANTGQDICSDPIAVYNGQQMADSGKVIFKGSAPQTYTFDDGAGTIGLHIDNIHGVSTTSLGTLRVSYLNVVNGTFVAPSGTLALGKGSDTTYMGFLTTGLRLEAGGVFDHNNGKVSFASQTTYADGRTGLGIIDLSGNGITLYDMEVNMYGKYTTLTSAFDNYRLSLDRDTNLIVENSYVVNDGRMIRSNSGGVGSFIIKGSYVRNCPDPAINICAGTDHNHILRFENGATTITLDSNVESTNLCSGSYCGVYIDVGIGNTITINSDFTIPVDFTLTSGTFHIADGIQGYVGDDIINNSIVTCGVGAYMTINDSAGGGTPLGGNDLACYGP